MSKNKTLRILLVEDAPADAALVEAFLDEVVERDIAGVEVLNARSLAEAMSILGGGDERDDIDVIMLDLGLPDARGLEVVEAVRKKAREIPLVVVSGHDDREMALGAVAAGAEDYLLKGSFDGGLLMKTIRYAIERTHFKERLAAEERRFRALIEHARDAQLILDADGSIVYASPAAAVIMGAPVDVQQGQYGLELVHPDDKSRVEAAFARVLAEPGASESLEARVMRLDGAWRWLDATFSNYLHLPSVGGVVVNYRDVTDRKESELALQRSEAMFRTMAEHLPAALVMLRDGQMVYGNRMVSEITGYSPEALAKRPVWSLAPEYQERAQQRLELMSASDAPLDPWEFEILTKSGERRRIQSTSTRVFYQGEPVTLGIAMDVTEHQQVRQRMHLQSELLAQIASAVIATDLDGVINYWNAFAEELYGWKAEDAIGKTIAEVTIPEASLETAGEVMAEVLVEGSWAGEFPVQRRDGTRFVSWTQLARLEDVDGEHVGYVGASSDISELKEAQAEAVHLSDRLAVQVSHLRAVRQIDAAIIAAQGADRTLAVVAEQTKGELGADAVNVLLHDRVADTLVPAASVGFHSSPELNEGLRTAEGYAGRAATQRRPVHVPDLSAADPPFVRTELQEAEGFASYYAVPMVTQGALAGVLEMFYRDRTELGADARDFAEALGQQAAIAVANADLLEEIQRSKEELEQAYDRTIEGWARALDLKDEETAGHSQRVMQMTIELARRMGVSDSDLVHVRRGALLHDIGKMGVPDRILLKAGGLTPDEWVVMKRHTTLARDLLAPIAFLSAAIDIPAHHHERWDGTGYPSGLAGEAIPLAARIFAVVDVFDALTSTRTYREAWSRERAIAHLEANAGSHFDPEIVPVFLEMLRGQS